MLAAMWESSVFDIADFLFGSIESSEMLEHVRMAGRLRVDLTHLLWARTWAKQLTMTCDQIENRIETKCLPSE